MRFLPLFLPIALAFAAPPEPVSAPTKPIDQPNPAALRALRQRNSVSRPSARAASRQAISTAPILVLLVEFGGPDTFTFVPTGDNRSTWDPIARPDASEWTGKVGDCSNIVARYGITAPRDFTYQGPLHNNIERPRSASDASGSVFWTEDFSPGHYSALIAGDGVHLSYTRQDGSVVDRDLAGASVRDFYLDMSRGAYSLDAEVVGWLQVPHSLMWYGADPCPGRNSGSTSAQDDGGIPGAGNKMTLAIDAIEAVKAQYPDFDWTRFDGDGDGFSDNLWIVHAGIDQSESATILGRTPYGEGTLWATSGVISPPYQIAPGVAAQAALVVAENGAMGSLAHEQGHALGAVDLYAYDPGVPSPGIWTLMADNWVGWPSAAQPSAFDPWHLDQWGWLQPLVIADPAREYLVRLGQVGNFPAGPGVERGVRIELPDMVGEFAVKPHGSWFWWGNQHGMANARMSLAVPLTVPPAAVLAFDAAWHVEPGYDYFFVQVSADGGATWTTLTNADTVCKSAADWIGPSNGLPADMCAAGIGGFNGQSKSWPNLATERFSLAAFEGMQVLLRFWYMTDPASIFSGPFIDDVRVLSGDTPVFSDDAESGDANWVYSEGWGRYGAAASFHHGYYLQWRNTGTDGGADQGLGNPDYRFGPVPGGLLVWYYNDRYADNEVSRYLNDAPSFGPKGRLLLVDAHPDPVRDPLAVARGFNNAGANVSSRLQMRDAAFSLLPVPAFRLPAGWADPNILFPSRDPAPRFSDAFGYFPGARFASLGPAYSPPSEAWVAEMWDAGLVMPSTKAYGIRAPGFKATDKFLYNCAAGSNGYLYCTELNGVKGPAASGGSGNPGDVAGQYGWNVEILEQAASSALLRIWNSISTDMPPSAGILSPGPAGKLTGTVNIEATASDDKGLARVDFLVNGTQSARLTAAPWRFAWNTDREPNGPHTVTARACDTSGQCVSADRRYEVANPAYPIVTVKSPAQGATVTGQAALTIDLAGGAATRLEILADGNVVQNIAGAPKQFAWDASRLAPGLHTLGVRAYDANSRAGRGEVTIVVPEP